MAWIIEDDCLAPERYIKLTYRGPNPFSVYQSTFGICRKYLEIDPSDYWERDFRWDISEDPRSFYARIIIQKSLDNRSKIFFEIIMQGKQPKEIKQEGEVVVLIGAKLITEYRQDTPFQQSLFYKTLLQIYNFFFYFKVRRRYLEICKYLCEKIKQAYKELLKIE
ncbi:MAG: hypothetical protein QXI09_02385 [Candidatus Aenigmatarchaeota archaeon]